MVTDTLESKKISISITLSLKHLMFIDGLVNQGKVNSTSEYLRGLVDKEMLVKE